MSALVLFALLQAPFSLEPGTWWEYRESYTERLGALDSTSDETTRFEVRGSRLRPFLHQSGGADPGSGPVELGDDWIRLGPWTGEEPLPFPLEPGRAATSSGEDPLPGWTVEAIEEVTVPAGTFQTVRCALRTPRHVSLLWIAIGVGVVKESEGAPGSRPEIERVLLRWSTPVRHPDPPPPKGGKKSPGAG
jgi:hypothetical protein